MITFLRIRHFIPSINEVSRLVGGDRKHCPLNTVHYMYMVEAKLVYFYIHPRNK